jgi:Carboxypeptidase regulatory-like domain
MKPNNSRLARSRRRAFVLAALIFAAACRQGVPVVDPSARPPTTDGTISGRVVTTAGTPLSGRKLDFVNSSSGATLSVTSDANGAFTIKVPPGKYRLKLELRSGETLEKPTGDIEINRSDLDNNIQVVVR